MEKEMRNHIFHARTSGGRECPRTKTKKDSKGKDVRRGNLKSGKRIRHSEGAYARKNLATNHRQGG